MDTKKIMECEHQRLKKYENMSLPAQYKKIGIAVTIISFIGLFVLGYIDNEPEILRDLIKKSILVGLLIISISKDSIEDELTIKLRGKSYAMAFVFGVVYALVQPYITYFLSFLFNKKNNEDFLELGDFQLLFFMLIIQIMFYWMLKKYR